MHNVKNDQIYFKGFAVFTHYLKDLKCYMVYKFWKLPLKKLEDKNWWKQWNSSVSIFRSSYHDIIVAKLPGNKKPSRLPKSYSNDDILKGVDNLYVAVHRRGAPTDGDMVTIGNGVNSKKKRRDLAGKCWYISLFE